MADLLNSQPGMLAAVTNVGVPGYVKINMSGLAGGRVPNAFVTSAALITDIKGSFQTNTAFKSALDKRIYVYSFGDRMGSVAVSGLAFDSRCGTPVPNNPLTGGSLLTGLDEVVFWYRANRVSLSNSPVIITIGLSQVLRGFLIGLDYGTHSTELRSYSWTMRIATLPGMSLGFGSF